MDAIRSLANATPTPFLLKLFYRGARSPHIVCTLIATPFASARHDKEVAIAWTSAVLHGRAAQQTLYSGNF
ncbi:MAG: hypothetical protein A3J30_00140 [Candidatus Wildermuthbacteria bacterium RIFCSPLOWO2_02_FULL_47_9c]|uniref:Uncharacterized protein n=1 Tax=Candidatus Wildermuthbacteria bacterium RIFCSPLOWO2_02_FULL_47_9c TaxID=1802466 RepID=A0A1G2RVJ5_9BACT|nr:MAG: hypothetical protein A3J30_00140 [Candidatus Wildermuthbacteria bacterium RIFCSPLOWO2_02_FULL_47_9c]